LTVAAAGGIFRVMGSRDATTFQELLVRDKDADGGTPGDAAGGAAAGGLTAVQGAVRVALGGILWHGFGRPAQIGTGWWFVTGVDVQLGADDVFCPDLCGFRRRRGEPMPAGRPLRERPDWACEIIAPSTVGAGGAADAAADKAARAQRQARRRIPHLWIADAGERTLDTYRWTASGYDLMSRLGPGSTVRAAPFTEIVIAIDDVFADAR
jgi:hypothetical protein